MENKIHIGEQSAIEKYSSSSSNVGGEYRVALSCTGSVVNQTYSMNSETVSCDVSRSFVSVESMAHTSSTLRAVGVVESRLQGMTAFERDTAAQELIQFKPSWNAEKDFSTAVLSSTAFPELSDGEYCVAFTAHSYAEVYGAESFTVIVHCYSEALITYCRERQWNFVVV